MIAEVEDAIVNTLKQGLPYLRTCDSLAAFLVYDLDKLAMLSPAVYIAYDGGHVTQLMNAFEDHEMGISAVIITRNMRGDVAARHGVSDEKGAYEVLEDVWDTLSGNDCGINIDPLMLTEVVPLEGTKKLSMYGLRFKTRIRKTL